MKKIINIIISLAIISTVGGFFASLFSIQTVSAADCNNSVSFLGFNHWYEGLQKPAPDCSIMKPSEVGGIEKFIMIVVTNCLNIAFVAVAYITFFFILYGGFQFVISQGNSDKMAKARTTILNAAIGLVISLSAVAVVGFITNGLLGIGVSSSEGLAFEDVLNGALNIFYTISGAIAVIMIIISGMTMVTSGDKSDSVAKARNSILFSAIGIAVIISAKAITWFILGRF